MPKFNITVNKGVKSLCLLFFMLLGETQTLRAGKRRQVISRMIWSRAATWPFNPGCCSIRAHHQRHLLQCASRSRASWAELPRSPTGRQHLQIKSDPHAEWLSAACALQKEAHDITWYILWLLMFSTHRKKINKSFTLPDVFLSF